MDQCRADHMGMLATVVNSLALEDVFLREGIKARVMTAVEMKAFADTYTARDAVAALEAGAQRGTAAAALARGALPDVAPHGQHRERDNNQQHNNRGEIHLIYTKHEIHKSYVTLRLFSCILCISWLT